MRVSFGLLAGAVLAFAPLSSVFSGCATGSSAADVTFDSGTSTPGDDDTQPLPGDDDDTLFGDASPRGSEAGGGGGGTTDASTVEGGTARDAAADGAAADAGPPTTCAAALALAHFDFETGAQGWTHGISDGQTGTWPYDPWTLGTAVTSSPACPAGSCFGAELTENYAQCQRGYLLSPTLDLSTCAGHDLQLGFQHGYVFWNDGTFFDGGVIFVSSDGGATWKALAAASFPGVVSIQQDIDGFECTDGEDFEVDQQPGYTGSSASNAESVQLTIPAAMLSKQVQIKFSMGSGVSSATDDADTSRKYTRSGWRVDNVALTMP